MSGSRRLFLGIAVPLEIAERVHLAAAHCFPPSDAERMRFQAPRDLHLTLLFLGNVNDGALPALQRAASTALARHRAVELTITGTGAFPSTARPSVLWAGIAAPAGEGALETLHGDCVRCAQAAGLPVRARDAEGPFRAHVTLARVRSAPSRDAAASFFDLELDGTWRADEVVLFHSVAGAARAAEKYAKLARFPLAGG